MIDIEFISVEAVCAAKRLVGRITFMVYAKQLLL